MHVYKIQKLINGYALGASFGGHTYIAIPQKLVKSGVKCVYGHKYMSIRKDQTPDHKQTFVDQFGRNELYTLCYYEWMPQIKEKPQLTSIDIQPEFSFDTRLKLKEAWDKVMNKQS